MEKSVKVKSQKNNKRQPESQVFEGIVLKELC